MAHLLRNVKHGRRAETSRKQAQGEEGRLQALRPDTLHVVAVDTDSKKLKKRLQFIKESIIQPWEDNRHASRWARCCKTVLRYGVGDLGHPKENIASFKQIMAENAMQEKRQLIPWIYTQCTSAEEPHKAIMPSINMQHRVEYLQPPPENDLIPKDASNSPEERAMPKRLMSGPTMKVLHEDALRRVFELEQELEVAEDNNVYLKTELDKANYAKQRLEDECKSLKSFHEDYQEHVASQLEPALDKNRRLMKQNQKLLEDNWELHLENTKLKDRLKQLENPYHLGKRSSPSHSRWQPADEGLPMGQELPRKVSARNPGYQPN